MIKNRIIDHTYIIMIPHQYKQDFNHTLTEKDLLINYQKSYFILNINSPKHVIFIP